MKRVAIISGVNNYADSSIRNLRYAVEDTRKIANLLEQAGFETRYLYDASQGRHQDELDRVSRNLGSDDLLLFYFSGHGVDVNGRHLLLCQDARDSAIRFGRGGLWVEELKETLAPSGANRVFVFDTCREALLTRRGVANEMQGSTALRDVAAAPPASPDLASGSLTILCACDEGDTAQEDDELGHGLFSAAFMDCCREAIQERQTLRLDGDCVDAIHQRMTVIAREHSLSLRQRPWIQSTGAFPIILNGSTTTGSTTVLDDKPARIAPPPLSQAPAASKPKLQWWVVLDTQEKGPLDEAAVQDAIKQGKITRTTDCWRDGMDAWQPIGETDEWADAFPPLSESPPPIVPLRRKPSLSVPPPSPDSSYAESVSEEFSTIIGSSKDAAYTGCNDSELKDTCRKAVLLGEEAFIETENRRQRYSSDYAPYKRENLAKWERAAQLGLLDGMFLLGSSICGFDEFRDLRAQGIAWLEKAAREGHGPANRVFARELIESGNHEKGIRHLREVAGQGDPQACFMLAECYQKGEGVAKSREEYWRWMRLAAEHDHRIAKMDVEMLRDGVDMFELDDDE